MTTRMYRVLLTALGAFSIAIPACPSEVRHRYAFERKALGERVERFRVYDRRTGSTLYSRRMESVVYTTWSSDGRSLAVLENFVGPPEGGYRPPLRILVWCSRRRPRWYTSIPPVETIQTLVWSPNSRRLLATAVMSQGEGCSADFVRLFCLRLSDGRWQKLSDLARDPTWVGSRRVRYQTIFGTECQKTYRQFFRCARVR